MIPEKVTSTIDRANAVFARMDERDGSVRAAAQRERRRLNAGVFNTIKRLALVIGLISLATIVVGLVAPIGMFGFSAALGIAIAAALFVIAGGRREIVTPTVPADVPNGQMVQKFDSFIYRTRRFLPAPAQAEVDAISTILPPLRQTLERVPDLDPNAQDARRLMSKHLPGLIDSYVHVPSAHRGTADAEGKSADQRLVEALAAGRQALKDIEERLAKDDLMKFETQGRFIESRYKDAESFDRSGSDR